MTHERRLNLAGRYREIFAELRRSRHSRCAIREWEKSAEGEKERRTARVEVSRRHRLKKATFFGLNTRFASIRGGR